MKKENLYSLNADIFRWSLGDCTNHGLSSKVDGGKVYMNSQRFSLTDATGFPDTDQTKEMVVEILEGGRDDSSFIIIQDQCCGELRLRAIPLKDYISGKWTMFGGNFLWCCDSRFFKNPIKIHDRVE